MKPWKEYKQERKTTYTHCAYSQEQVNQYSNP